MSIIINDLQDNQAVETPQSRNWAGDFGRAYTDRNCKTPRDMDALYVSTYGVPRSAMNNKFLANLNKSLRVLEVGANVGVQLQLLQEMGFSNLYGIELQPYAVALSRQYTENINIIEGSAFSIPFHFEFFNLVFTSGVLIHISPDDYGAVMDEMYRCAKRYIWGFEYYAPEITPVEYRGHDNLLWKADFARLFMERHPNLKLIQKELYPYLNDPGLVDCMYLLEKRF